MTERPFKIGLNYRVSDEEYMVSVHDKALEAHPLAFDIGEDYYCVYGRTAMEAVEKALQDVADGSAAGYFRTVRPRYGIPCPSLADDIR